MLRQTISLSASDSRPPVLMKELVTYEDEKGVKRTKRQSIPLDFNPNDGLKVSDFTVEAAAAAGIQLQPVNPVFVAPSIQQKEFDTAYLEHLSETELITE